MDGKMQRRLVEEFLTEVAPGSGRKGSRN
jgi:hypothetical protein